MKYTINEMLDMDDCFDINCVICPFWSNVNDEKYGALCKADIYCEKNNIDYDNNGIIASKHYIQHLRKIDLIKLAMEL